MNWNTWWKKLGIHGALAVLPVAIAAVEQVKTPNSPPWIAVAVAGVLVGLRQLQNWLKHRNDAPAA
jgi:hypothetical protein